MWLKQERNEFRMGKYAEFYPPPPSKDKYPHHLCQTELFNHVIEIVGLLVKDYVPLHLINNTAKRKSTRDFLFMI